MRNLINSSNILKACLFASGTLFVIWVALYNGYPLVYSDTGTYLYSSIHLNSPEDRPMFYGLFLRLTGMQANNWVPIVFQGIIGYWVIFRVVKLFLEKLSAYWTFGIVLLLTILTSLPWYASQLMPDIFTAYGILLLYLLFYDASKKWVTVLYLFLLFLSSSTHLSNVLIFGASFGLLSFFHSKEIFKRKSQLRAKWIIGGVLIILVFPLQAYLNYVEKGEFVVTRASNLFFVAKGLESNLYKTYVRENKDRMDIPFEEQTESFKDIPTWFLWDYESPLYTSGLSRVEVNRRFGPVVKDILSKWRYQKMFISEFFRAGKEQIKLHRVGSGLAPYKKGTPPHSMIDHEFHSELSAFESSVQSRKGLDNNYHLGISKFVFNTSLLIMLLAALYRPTRQKLGMILLFVFMSIIFNALVTGGIANVYDRLQVRVNWLYTFTAILALITTILHLIKKSQQQLPDETEH